MLRIALSVLEKYGDMLPHQGNIILLKYLGNYFHTLYCDMYLFPDNSGIENVQQEAPV